jgi:hypothetical protein
MGNDQTMLQIMEHQVKPKPRLGKKATYMCRLCGKYDVVLRKAHLANEHNASKDRLGKRSCDGMLKEIFGEPNL